MTQDLNLLMNRFRRAARETFNNYYRGEDQGEADAEAFLPVERLLFQTLVLDLVSPEDGPYGEPCRGVRFRPRRAGGLALLQDGDDAGRSASLATGDVVRFRRFFDEDFYAPHDLEFVLGDIDVAGDEALLGRQVLMRVSEITFD